MLQEGGGKQMSFESNVKSYLRAYQTEYKSAIQGGQHTAELSFRVPIHTLLDKIGHDLNPSGNFSVILEPKNQGKMGRPDWRVQDKVSLGVYGYIEAKGPSNEYFDNSPYQEQISRDLTLGHKLSITEGIEFVFCFTASPVVVSIIDKSRMGNADWSRLPINPLFKFYMEQFFSEPAPQRIDEEKLIELVAIRTRTVADDLHNFTDLSIEEALDDDERHVIEILTGLKDLVYKHNDPNLRTGVVFEDFTAQVIMFCLLYAHRVICTSEDSPSEKEKKIFNYAFNDLTEEEALSPFRKLMIYLRDKSGTDTFIGQWVNECIAFLSFVQMTNDQLLNPDFHRLFELFLNKFDKQTRFDYGAFYTPKNLAEFIVKLVNKIVEQDFDGASIYDEGNTIIDPCCGTGSFLEQIVAQDKSDSNYNLCGFEILPAPYMLANYRMTLVERHYAKKNLHPSIILANTLSNYLLGPEADDPSIEGNELKRARELCSRPLKLIIGNPPSSDKKRSNTSSDFSRINDMMEDFRPPARNRRGRQNTQKQVANPFMQFLRWSCEKLLVSDCHSVLAFIVPLSFLEAESYKYARKYLSEHFTKIWAIAIDEDARTGIRGDSLFKTMQGRAIIILTRKIGGETTTLKYNFIDISHFKREEKAAVLEGDINEIINRFEIHKITKAMYSFMPSRPFDEEMYAKFWPISTETGEAGIFLNQCSGVKTGATALITHVKQPMLKRRSREINSGGIPKAREWVGQQDVGSEKRLPDKKIQAFQDALRTCSSRQELDTVLEENIRLCSFRPYVNSNTLIWDTIFEYQIRATDGKGARIRPEIKAVYELPNTVGFALAHAPKDLAESLGQFTSFCWYLPDNDLSRRGDGHVYLNQYIPNPRTGAVINNINKELLNHYTGLTGITAAECAKKVVFYSYAAFCSQVYLEEFYGALFVVNQSENRARIPVVDSGKVFLRMAELGEKLANLEKNDVTIENVLGYNYEMLLSQLPSGFHLLHNKQAACSPYDEENEELILRNTDDDKVIRMYCPIALQHFTIGGYNVIKDCWIKFHSYRYTRCDFTRADFKELLDLLNKISIQMQIVEEIDEIMHDIVSSNIALMSHV